jgi:hypothetical protein
MPQVLIVDHLDPQAILVLNEVSGSGGGGGITQAAADLRYLKLAADNDPLTGTLTTLAIEPTSNAASDIGSLSLRYKDAFVTRLNAVSGTPTSLSAIRNYLLAVRAAGAGTTDITLEPDNPFTLCALIAGANAAAGSTATISVKGRANTFIGGVEDLSGSGVSIAELSGVGNFCAGLAEYGSRLGETASGPGDIGCFVHGNATDGSSITSNQAYGGFAQGYAGNGGQIIVGDGGPFYGGGFAQGAAVGGNIAATGQGTMARGATEPGGAIVSSGTGSIASGYSSGAGYGINCTGAGSAAMGYGFDAAITVFGNGAMGFGFADVATGGNIEASADGAIQFGPGTNAEANSLKIGNGGLRLKGTTGAPGTPVNGDIYVSGGYVVVRSNGLAVNIEPAGGLTQAQTLARTLGA